MSQHNHTQKGELFRTPVSTQEGENPSTPWTPAHHVSVNKSRPKQLLALTTGPHGKAARLAFDGGWERTIDLPTEADAWHPLFDDLVIDHRIDLRKHCQEPDVIAADGTRKRTVGLSFVTETRTKRRGHISTNHFDVPAEEYGAGNITGYRCAEELLDAMKRGYGPHLSVNWILQEVGVACAERSTKPSRRGAAVAMLEVMVESLRFLAKHGRHAEWLERKVQSSEATQAHLAALDAADRAAFVIRMQAARAQRRAERAALQQGARTDLTPCTEAPASVGAIELHSPANGGKATYRASTIKPARVVTQRKEVVA